jgi:MFS family permease
MDCVDHPKQRKVIGAESTKRDFAMSKVYETTIGSKAHLTPRSSNTLVLTGLTAGHGIFHVLYQSFLVVLPTLKDALGISPVQVGAIIAAREIASGVASIPGGIVCDRLQRHWGLILAICIGGFGLGWLLVGLSPAYGILILGMVLVGVSSSIWHLPAMAALSQRFSDRRGMALAVHGIGGNIGDVLGPAMTGVLLTYVVWRNVISAYSLVPLFLALVVIWAFRDIGQTSDTDTDTDGDTFAAQMKVTTGLLKNRTLWRVNLVSGLRGMCYEVYVAFLPLYLADELGFGSRAIGFHIALMFSVGILASPLMGYLSDRFGRKSVLVPTLMGSCLLSVALALFGQGIILTVIVALLGLFLRSDYSLLSATVLDIVGHQVATTTLGVLSFTRFLMGAISPIIAGLLYQTLGMDATLFYASGLFALAALIFLTTRLQAEEQPHSG